MKLSGLKRTITGALAGLLLLGSTGGVMGILTATQAQAAVTTQQPTQVNPRGCWCVHIFGVF